MVPGNYESSEDKCLLGASLTRSVKQASGFQWLDEASGQKRPKWGYVATEPGAVLQLQVSTVATSNITRPEQLPVSSAARGTTCFAGSTAHHSTALLWYPCC
jgi:hypothetical protein